MREFKISNMAAKEPNTTDIRKINSNHDLPKKKKIELPLKITPDNA